MPGHSGNVKPKYNICAMIIDEIIHIDFQKNISKLKFSAFMTPFSIVQQGPLLFLVSFINNDPLTSNNIKSKCVLVWCSLTVEGGPVLE